MLVLLALFAIAPITCSCLVSLLYSLYLFIAYEESGLHYAQEFEVSIDRSRNKCLGRRAVCLAPLPE